MFISLAISLLKFYPLASGAGVECVLSVKRKLLREN